MESRMLLAASLTKYERSKPMTSWSARRRRRTKRTDSPTGTDSRVEISSVASTQRVAIMRVEPSNPRRRISSAKVSTRGMYVASLRSAT